jgi:hypothetical protein
MCIETTRSLPMEPRREEYQGHVIELREPSGAGARRGDREAAATAEDDEPELLIDDVPVGYGQLPDGSYALRDYAYDWTGDLFDLARRFIDHQNRTG